MTAALILCFLAQAGSAAQVSSDMGVGLTIGPSLAPSGKRANRPLIVPAVVTRYIPATSYTWNAAALSVKGAGFKQLRRVEKSATFYWFEAKRLGGSFRIAVSVASGKIVKIARA